MPSIVLGCDPGLSGALAFLDECSGRLVAVYDMPLVPGDRRTEVDFLRLVEIVETHSPRLAITEDVWGVAGCGAKSSFNFGAAYGCLIGAFHYMRRPPLVRVRPQAWQGYVFPLYLGEAAYDTKAASRYAAAKVFTYDQDKLTSPKGRTVNHNRSDAALIAWYGSRAHPTNPTGSFSDKTRKGCK